MSTHVKNPAISFRTIWKYGAALGAFACLSLAYLPASAQTEAANPNTSVSSDGERIALKPTLVMGVNSYEGTGILPSVRLRETASEFQALLNARPMTAPTGVESIIGADQRMRVNPTTSFPARATVLITFDPPGAGTAICSGWMIGRNTVATAGHCVAKARGAFYDRTKYKIYPGRNGASAPYSFCTAKQLYSVVGWVTNGLDDYDYGAIKLNCNIGNTTGWYGFFWQAATLVGKPITTQGYPGDKPLTQWRALDQVRANDLRRVFYQADTVGGQSGSPVWQMRAAGSPYCVGQCGLAIHAYGTGGTGVYATNNHGTRITQSVFTNLVNWKNAP